MFEYMWVHVLAPSITARGFGQDAVVAEDLVVEKATEMSAEGWEFVTATPDLSGQNAGASVFFKRPQQRDS